jgi:protein-tyrosine phosphatase
MKILMVCLGNICRSPLAEGILQQMARDKGLDWTVDSAGTSGYHNGEKPDSRSIEAAKKNGININHQRSRQFIKQDFEDYDLILVMDQQNYQNVKALSSGPKDREKVQLILNYSYPNENRGVPDPYYEGGFDYVFKLLKEACDKVLKSLTNLD